MKKETAVLILPLIMFFALGSPWAQTQRREGRPPRHTSKQEPQSVAWEGTYTYQEGGGRSAGDAGMFVEHTIKLYRRGAELVADLDAAGFQVSMSLLCSTKVEGEKISLYFDSYREDNLTETYRRGQLLLSLERVRASGRTRILTRWGAYRPTFTTGRSWRVYFKRVK